ncbi:mCG144582, isoform CRA_a, partial [Mus musculus]
NTHKSITKRKISKIQRLEEYKVSDFGFKIIGGWGQQPTPVDSLLQGLTWEGEKRLRQQKQLFLGQSDNPKNATDTSNAWWRELEDSVDSVEKGFLGKGCQRFCPCRLLGVGWFPLLKCPTTISKQPSRVHSVLRMGTQWLRGCCPRSQS